MGNVIRNLAGYSTEWPGLIETLRDVVESIVVVVGTRNNYVKLPALGVNVSPVLY